MLSKVKKLILLSGDFVFLRLALVLTILIRYPKMDFSARWSDHSGHFLLISFIWLILFHINNLYNLNIRAGGRKFFRLSLNAIAASSLLSILYFYLNTQSNITPKTTLLIFTAIFIGLFFVWRWLYQSLVQTFIPQENLGIIGLNNKSAEIIKELQNNPGSGYSAAIVFKNLEELQSLSKSINEKNIRAIVVCDDFGNNEKIQEVLFSCLPYQITFFNYPDFYELLTGKVPVEAIGPNWFLNNLREGGQNYFNSFKYFTDLIIAGLIFIISLPFWPLIALAIKLTSRGPVFFRQARLGKNEKIFQIIKFRTMREQDNDRSLTIEKDGRITAVGSFLRKTRLDEIPQVLNILRGEMSFIGPRPERPEIVAELEKQIPFYKTRSLIKPGISGWDQVSGHYHSSSIADTLEKLQYDLFYLKHRSLYLDFNIILKTLATMMSRQGR